jgi:hypothetical protein
MLWSERLRKIAGSEPSTKDGIEIFVSLPRSSEITSRSMPCHDFFSTVDGYRLTLTPY